MDSENFRTNHRISSHRHSHQHQRPHHQKSPSGDTPYGQPKLFSLSSWSVNLLSGARDRLTNLTSSLAALGTDRGGSWSPMSMEMLSDDANNNPRENPPSTNRYQYRTSPKFGRVSSSPESGTGLYVYSIEDFSTIEDSGNGTSSSIVCSSLNTQRSTQSLHSIATDGETVHRHKSSSAAKFYRRSPRSNHHQRLYQSGGQQTSNNNNMRNPYGNSNPPRRVIDSDYPVSLEDRQLNHRPNSDHNSTAMILSVNNLNSRMSLDIGTGRRSKTRRHQPRKQNAGGSLESVDLEEDDFEENDEEEVNEDDDLDEGYFRSPQNRHGHNCRDISSSDTSGSCTPDSLSQSPTFAMFNSPEFGPDLGLYMSSSTGSGGGVPGTPSNLTESFARHMGYESLANVVLYSELLEALNARAKYQLESNGMDLEESGDRPRPRGCSKFVPRFGLGYEDGCHFPLVLSVFVNDCLSSMTNKKRPTNTFVTWETINLMADAELSRWEMSALNNLSKTFYSTPILGTPTRYITPDPNFFLRNLLRKLSNTNSLVRNNKLAHFERNRSLKRWNSLDDLVSSESTIEPEFQQTKIPNHKSQWFTDDCLAISRGLAMDLAGSNSLSPTTTTTKSPVWPESSMGTSHNSQFQELLTRLNSTSVSQFACFLSKQYLHRFRSQEFNVQFLAQLVLLKDIGIVGGASGGQYTSSDRMVNFVRGLLTFDDCLVSAIGSYVRQQTSSVARQASALATLIEICCILRQLGNFYALSIVIGAIQSPANYRMTEAWLHLSYHHPYHFSDYKRLCRFTRRVDVSILGNGSSYGAQAQIIPTLPALLNRLRLYCAACWDLYEAKRRFNLHPSLADWINTEVIVSRRSLKSSLATNPNSMPVSERATRLIFDPIRETFLGNDGPRIRLMSYDDFPINWIRQRDVSSMPDRFVRRLLSDLIENRTSSAAANLFQQEIDNITRYFVLPATTGSTSSFRYTQKDGTRPHLQARPQPQPRQAQYQLRQNSL